MTWNTSFRDAYVDRFRCTVDEFESDLLRRGLHRRAVAFRPVIYLLLPRYFEVELRIARLLGNSRRSQEFRSEVETYQPHYRRHGSFMRRVLGGRLSGKRLVDILTKVAPDRNMPG